ACPRRARRGGAARRRRRGGRRRRRLPRRPPADVTTRRPPGGGRRVRGASAGVADGAGGVLRLGLLVLRGAGGLLADVLDSLRGGLRGVFDCLLCRLPELLGGCLGRRLHLLGRLGEGVAVTLIAHELARLAAGGDVPGREQARAE